MIKNLLILLFPILSLAHPHLFIDTNLHFTIKKDKIESLHVAWIVDDMNSQILMMDFDSNRDKKLDKKETERFQQIYFDKLSNSKSFTHIKVDGKVVDLLKQISPFNIEYKNNLLIINFTVDFKKIKQIKTVDIGFWDEENYTAFSMEPEDISFKGKILKTEFNFYEEDLFVTDVLKVIL